MAFEEMAFKSNINIIIPLKPPHGYEPIVGTTVMRGLLCRAYRAGEGERMKVYLAFDPNYRVGSHSREVACKQLHDLPVGVYILRELGPTHDAGKLRMKFNAILRRQCDEAPCVIACPQSALERRESGVVIVKGEACNGRKECIETRPSHALWFNSETRSVEKRDLCVDKGLEAPFCVKHRMSGALRLKVLNS